MEDFIEISLSLIILDLSSRIIASLITNKSVLSISPNTRWFFIHCWVNLIASINTYKDLTYCIKNIEKCTLEKISSEGFYSAKLVLLLHFYHMVVFYKHLKYSDWFHHVVMTSFNAPLLYYKRLKIQSVVIFFLCGLPGFIDYFLLYLVKTKLIDIKIEKNIYLFLSSYVRSPGSLLAVFLSIPYFLREQTHFDYTVSFIGISLIFWNGQYYMSKTCKDYGKKYKDYGK